MIIYTALLTSFIIENIFRAPFYTFMRFLRSYSLAILISFGLILNFYLVNILVST